MPEKFVLVEESQLAVFTARMSLVTFIVAIANASVCRQVLSCVSASLCREDFEILRADFAVEHLVGFADMLLQLLELHERRVVTFGAAMLQQAVERLLKFVALESDAIFLLVQSRAKFTVQGRIWSDCLREHDLIRTTFSYQIPSTFHNHMQNSPSASPHGKWDIHSEDR